MSSSLQTTLHFIQDTPTPHNNVLLKALQANPGVDLKIWYAMLQHPQYSFPATLANEAGVPIVYGYRRPGWNLVGTALRNARDKYFIVGWMNPTTRLLVVLFWLLRRPYNMWFDRPNDKDSSPLKTLLRNVFYWLLRTSRANVYVVGAGTREYFARRGFPEARLTNLPILVAVDKAPDEYRGRRAEIRARYNARDADLFVVTGSRLIREKGFDLLIDALACLDNVTRSRVRVLIVGKGEEKPDLLHRALDENVADAVFFEDWMGHDDFMAHLGAADLAVHPARYDAYGGITLSAMVAGVPVVGSDQAGSARERIEHGVNGWLYRAEDVTELAQWLATAVAHRDALKAMGVSARRTAERYSPAAGATTLLQSLA
jgi:glycosyltransferase involved in cell wall biosynthesis